MLTQADSGQVSARIATAPLHLKIADNSFASFLWLVELLHQEVLDFTSSAVGMSPGFEHLSKRIMVVTVPDSFQKKQARARCGLAVVRL